MKKILFILFSLVSLIGSSQSDPCGFDHIKMMGMIDTIEYHGPTYQGNRDQIFTIPVVFHVIHLGEDVGVGTNISDEQILDALRIVNEDLRKTPNTWGDGDGVDTEIELCLARRDPNGVPTSGINRVNGNQWTDYPLYGISSAPNQPGTQENLIKTATSWDRSKYINVWIVSEIQGNNGNAGVQGYAYFPTPSIIDGIVLLHNVVGSIGNVKETHNKSRVFVHEVGHYFGLYHTFEGYTSCYNASNESDCVVQGDKVCDTPPTISNSSCYPSFNDCPITQRENYMDYTNQDCRNMFTQGQKSRMRSNYGLFHYTRQGLLESDGCVPLDYANLTLTEPKYFLHCETPSIIPQVRITNTGGHTVDSFQVSCNVSGTGYNHTMTWESDEVLETGDYVVLTFPSVANDYMNGTITFSLVNEDYYIDDNQVEKDFISEPSQEVMLVISTDFWGNWITWEFTDENDQVVWEGGNYPNVDTLPYFEISCLPIGCYTLTIQDPLSDLAFMELLSGDGQTIQYYGTNNGTPLVINFCLDEVDAETCVDSNFNWICDYDEILQILGCTDPIACNFNPVANMDSGECYYSGEVYDCFGECNLDIDFDGICDQLEILGCTDPVSCNYNEIATENFECEYPIFGYTCDGVPLTSLNTVTGITELINSNIVQKIIVYDIQGREINLDKITSSGVYLINLHFRDSTIRTYKVHLN